jgi:hypothetical protein
MGLASSVTGAGLGFATYETLCVAYRNRVGHSPSPSERGALAGARTPLPPLFGSYSLAHTPTMCQPQLLERDAGVFTGQAASTY